MNKVLLIFTILFVFASPSWAQEDMEIAIDSSLVEQRQFEEDIAKRYTGKQYKYDTLEGETTNLIFKAIQWVLEKLGKIFNVEFSTETILLIEKIIYALLIIFAVYIVVKLLVGKQASSFFSRKSRDAAPLQFREEHIENIDLDNYIKNALKENNYRLAIRYMYLKSLKLLSAKNLIDWHFEKTNTDYFNEIENDKLKENFKKISYWYDHIWYGEFPLDARGFDTAQKDFERLNQNLNYAG